LGKVTAVTDATVIFDVYVNLKGDLDGTWTLSKNLKRTYNKDVVIRKRIVFTKEGFLKKGDKNFLQTKYTL
jgi:hypothetical protein